MGERAFGVGWRGISGVGVVFDCEAFVKKGKILCFVRITSKT